MQRERMEITRLEDFGAASKLVPDLTINELNYIELLLCFNLLSDQTRGWVIICGDSNFSD